MTESRLPRRQGEEGNLPAYLNERPKLLLKLLDIAEACWDESREQASCMEADHRECA